MKKLTLILVIILIVSSLGGGLSSVAFAATNGIESSAVLSDLQNSKIAGEDFNADNYGYTDERAPQVLAFAEYGFAFNKSASDYAVYIYVYNPTGKEIKAQRNSISVATVYENGNAVDYDKFALKLLDVSDGKYARLFYKFKIADPTKLHTRVAANTNARRYDVSEIELNFGDSTSEAFDVGNYYEYSGYAQGFGADSKAESTLECQTDKIDVLGLDVKSTYYRYENGYYTQTNLSSVYFGVPNTMFENYGKLQQIKANWFETHTERQIVLEDLDYYEQIISQVGISLYDQKISLGTIDGKRVHCWDTNSFNATDDYRGRYLFYEDTGCNNLSKSRVSNYKLLWVFHSPDGIVAPNQIAEYARTYTEKFNSEDLIIGKYNSELFMKSVDEGRQYGWQGVDGSGVVIDADSLITIDGFTPSSNLQDWWLKLWGFKFEHESLKDKTPIYIVSESDLIGSTSTVAERLLIAESDVEILKTTFTQNKQQGKKTVLFRFATTDYYSTRLSATTLSNDSIFPDYAFPGYVAEQTAFLDFDIIWLKFVKENQSTVIPCVSSPIDIFGGLTPPPKADVRNIWAIIVAIVVVVILLIVLFKLLKVLFRKKNQR